MAQMGSGSRAILVSAALVITIGGLRVAEPILVPLLLGGVLAIATLPPLRWLARKGIPQGLGIVLIMLAVGGILGVFGAVLGGSIDEFRGSLPEYQKRIETLEVEILESASKLGVGLPQSLAETLDVGSLVASNFAAAAKKSLAGLAGAISNIVFILLVAVFALSESLGFRDKLSLAMGGDPMSAGRLARVVDEIQKYLTVKTGTSAVTGIIVGSVLAIAGVDFAVLWGSLAFLLNFIPTLGSIIAAIPAVLIALLEQGTGTALGIAICYVVVNIVIGNIIEPRVMGRTLGLSPLVVLLSMIFWGWVLGLVGALLAVPLTMIVKIVMENSDDLRPIAILLGPSLKRSGDKIIMS